jgi:thioester reductase-like protein
MPYTEVQLPITDEQIETWLTGLVAGLLGLRREQLDTDTHLSRYGLDSVNTISILTAISDKTGLQIPDAALIEHPTIALFASYIRSQTSCPDQGDPDTDKPYRPQSLMISDSVLPENIQPPAGTTADTPAAILLTGATGFLGIHLLDILLEKTTAHIYCLMRRSGEMNLLDRLKMVSSFYGLESSITADRITTLEGDLSGPQAGLPSLIFSRLSETVDAIYHCAADVNWALDYSGLRQTNVLPTVELLRLACTEKKKHFIFVSSISVCYAYHGPEYVSEKTPLFEQLDSIHLGYAQSKLVSEALCTQAYERGLPVTIHRPALILGSSVTGLSNQDDLVSRVIKGCISMGCAPDLDWPVDACPVNEVADAICRLSQSAHPRHRITHLVHPQPRRWRELVLWMNIYGYRVGLLPFREWADRVRRECNTADHPLYPLRSFIMRQIPEAGNLAFPELYEEHRRSRVLATDTDSALAEAALEFTSLDSDLLQRYFNAFTTSGFLPRPSGKCSFARRDPGSTLNRRFFTSLAPGVFRSPDARLQQYERLHIPPDSSIITDLASWKFGRPSGLFRYRLVNETSSAREVFIKIKPDDKSVLEVAAAVGELSVPGLGNHFLSYGQQTGLEGCHKRELAIYRQNDPRFKQHIPHPYLLIDRDAELQWIIAMEAIERPIYMDSHSRANRWSPENIMTCIDGMATLHSIWLGHEPEMLKLETSCNVLSAQDMEDARPLWHAVAQHADSHFFHATGNSLDTIRDRLVDSIATWWHAGESLDRTLIHNDFNPRNLAIVNRQDHPAICIYDWELATCGLPQRDLAEFLCFTLPPDHDGQEARHYIERHRIILERESGRTIRADDWLHGFQLALFDLAVNRIPMYTLVHRIRPQAFLERITRTWHTLFREYRDAGLYR